MDVFDRYESEVKSYCRAFPTTFDKAKGVRLWDTDGKEYLDFFSGAGALNYGHNNDGIKGKLIEYLSNDRIMHGLDMHTVAKREFIDYFETNLLQPRGLDYKIQFTGPTGTNAVEAALKLARKYTHRSGIFAFMGAFHGMTLGSLALTTDASDRGGAGVALNNVTHIPAPYMFPELDVIKYMETLISDDHSGVSLPAAVIIEPLQADGGIYPMEPEFMKRLRKFCTDHDILLICDDIQAGCGRTGWFFSFERSGIVPDIVTVSKSISGYGVPMSLVLMKPEIDCWNPGEHTGTFRGNQIAFVAAKAALELMLGNNMESETRRKGAIVEKFLSEDVLPLGDLQVRGCGLFWGIDTVKYPGAASKITQECFKNGLIIEHAGRNGAVMKVMPPLVISDEDLMKGLEIVCSAVKTVIA